MSATDFEQNDDLDGLSSEELEERAFGPGPTPPRAWGRRKRGRRAGRPQTREVAVRPVAETRSCYACGERVETGVRVCSACGVRQPRVPRRRGRLVRRGDRRANPSKPTATLLALVLGGVGAHRLYLGQTKTGLTMLLFCWTLLPALVGAVDFLRYLFMSDREFAERYGAAGGAAALPPPRPALPPGLGAGGEEGDPVVRVAR